MFNEGWSRLGRFLVGSSKIIQGEGNGWLSDGIPAKTTVCLLDIMLTAFAFVLFIVYHYLQDPVHLHWEFSLFFFLTFLPLPLS
jgi:hypothetical protein